jgi:arylsulfatase A-like enzyme
MHTKPRGNVLFITADQWRADTLGAVGHPVVQTPNLDRLAASGVRFANHFAQTAPCGPARASLLTGMYMANHRVVGNGAPLDRRFTNMALEARKAGHAPTLIGYTDTTVDPRGLDPADPSLRSYEGLLPGFDVELNMPGPPTPWLNWLRNQGYDVPWGEAAVYEPLGVPPAGRGATFPPAMFAAEHSETAFLTHRTLDWLSSRTQEPWFLHLSMLAPHPPWVVSEPYNAMYDPADMTAPVRAETTGAEAAQHPLMDHWLGRRTADIFTGGKELAAGMTELDQRQACATYCGLVSEVDANLGRILDFLEDSGQIDNTLIVFTTDHGEQLGDHHLFGKLGWFDQSFHIPLIIRAPNTPEGQRGGVVKGFTEAIDVMPTILEWLGLNVPAQCDGHALTPFLQGKAPQQWRDAAHWEFDFRNPRSLYLENIFGLSPDQCGMTILRTSEHKYVHMSGLPPILYDLREDPGETRNRAGDPAMRGVQLCLLEQMMTWRMGHDDRILANTSIGPEGVHTWSGPRP